MNNEHKKLPVFGRRPLLPVGTGAPVGLRCIQLQIPDSDAALRQLAGVLRLLTFWKSFERESNHYGTQWAQAWLSALQNDVAMEPCMSIQFQQDLCGLSVSFDGGETWLQIYDGMDCLTSQGAQEFFDGLIDDRIQDLIDDGTLQRAGGQPGPSSPPAYNECKDYHVILGANDKWKIPFTVSAGDSIHITNAIGGWTDGTLAWYCPDGSRYLLGICDSTLHSHQAGDPSASAWHMALIGGYNTTTPAYFDPLTATYVIPAGVVNQECWIQPNDQTLSDNAGQVEFDVQICSGAWCYKFDYTSGLDTLFVQKPYSGTPGAVWSSNRWNMNSGSSRRFLWITLDIPAGTIITSITAHGQGSNISGAGASNDMSYWTNTGGTGTMIAVHGMGMPAWSGDITWDYLVTTERSLWIGSLTANMAAQSYIDYVIIRGSGTNPFGSNNC